MRKNVLLLFACAVIFASCSPDKAKESVTEVVEEVIVMDAPDDNDIQEVMMEPANTTPNVDIGMPLDKEGLHAYLKEGKYKEFKHFESEAHPSRGPHTRVGKPVQVYMNTLLAESLDSGNDEHPMGSITVKEMYEGETLMGWAVMAKTAPESEYGQNWFWYETVNVEDASEVVGMGNGVPLCVGCHIIGDDMVRTKYPFE